VAVQGETRSVRELDEPALVELAADLAPGIELPLTLYLEGDLGAGKTTFARALIRALGHSGRVKSPSYGLLEVYELPRCRVLHLDLYRLEDPGEVEFLGIADLLDRNSLLLVEWPAHGAGVLPGADAVISFDYSGNGRRLSCHAYSISGMALCDSFHSLL
jgi:tRNA threonylcarbamoyladenosine biosynthesis protein TsaE